MNLFATPLENLAFLWLMGGFTSFMLCCRLFGVFSRTAYYSLVGKIHLVFTVGSSAGFTVQAWSLGYSGKTVATHALLIALWFLLLHYGFFTQWIGLIKKSVSLNLLLQIVRTPGLSVNELLRAYGDGKGTDFLVLDRLHQMAILGWVSGDKNHLHITPSGKRVARRYSQIKWFFGLESPLDRFSREANA